MSRAVWKYQFPPGAAAQTIEGSYGTTPRFFAAQGQTLCIWAETQPDGPGIVRWTVVIVGTGHELPPGDWTYLGSTLVDGGEFVFHAFYRLKNA